MGEAQHISAVGLPGPQGRQGVEPRGWPRQLPSPPAGVGPWGRWAAAASAPAVFCCLFGLVFCCQGQERQWAQELSLGLSEGA